MIIDPAALRTMIDPVERITAVDQALAALPELQTELGAIKAETLRELLRDRTGAEVAAILGVNRTSLYRSIRPWTVFRSPTGEDLAEVIPVRTATGPNLPEVGARVRYQAFDGKSIDGVVVSIKQNGVILGQLGDGPKDRRPTDVMPSDYSKGLDLSSSRQEVS